jgi:hypothetical protein
MQGGIMLSLSRSASKVCLAALVLSVSSAALAASPDKGVANTAVSPPASADDLELDEVLVEGRKPMRDPLKVREWMTRLAGRFLVDGSVDLHGNGAATVPLPVDGRGDCTGFFPIPAVQCELKLHWPETKATGNATLLGGKSALDPAALLYTYDTDRIGIRYMLVDDMGIADGVAGYLYGDTLITRSKCVNVPGNCQRIAWITAEPEMKEVVMKIDLEIDGSKAASFRFVMHRAPGKPAAIYPEKGK